MAGKLASQVLLASAPSTPTDTEASLAAATSDLALAVFAVAPHALGGVHLRATAGLERDAWLQTLQQLLPSTMPWRRMPVQVDDETLLGGLDLTATLAAGHPVHRKGLLAQTEGGVLLAAMAERLSPERASRLAAAIDAGSPLAVVALDESMALDETPPASLLDRLALQVQPGRQTNLPDLAAIEKARLIWQQVYVDDRFMEALVAAAQALGVDSLRAACHAVNVARIAAALAGRNSVVADDAALAARLVLAPRATQLPAPVETPDETPVETPDEPPVDASAETPDEASKSEADTTAQQAADQTPSPKDPPFNSPPNPAPDNDAEKPNPPPAVEARPRQPPSPNDPDNQPLDERVLDAALAALPPGLLSLLQGGGAAASRRGEAGRAGAVARSTQRGRVVGAVRGEPRSGARLALVETLRAAAPWQRARRLLSSDPLSSSDPLAANRVLVTRDDLRVQRRVQHRATTTIFAIDASGSQALHRLAEAKGAVELLLADCYARRDRVAVIGFRGAGAQLLLAPTRSLVRAKRQLAGLPGGGGTPLAAGLDAATELARSVRRGGAIALLVLLTDGRANIARDGTPGRAQATLDAVQAARVWGATGSAALLIDTSVQRSAAAQTLADHMQARLVVLPAADAHALSKAVQQQR